MSLDDWIHKYPQVQQLLQQPDEVLRDTWDEELPCEAYDEISRDPVTGARRECPCGERPARRDEHGRPLCAFHDNRLWIHPCCGLREKGDTYPVEDWHYHWDSDKEYQWRRTDYAFCDDCRETYDED